MVGRSIISSVALLMVSMQMGTPAKSQPVSASPIHHVEWVYRVKYGYQDEWWRLFRKYQITALDEQKRRGYIQDYKVVVPDLHTSEDARWDYRIIVSYREPDGLSHEEEVARALFPDAAQRTKDENRRWELTLNHWDLPIHPIDPHTAP